MTYVGSVPVITTMTDSSTSRRTRRTGKMSTAGGGDRRATFTTVTSFPAATYTSPVNRASCALPPCRAWGSAASSSVAETIDSGDADRFWACIGRMRCRALTTGDFRSSGASSSVMQLGCCGRFMIGRTSTHLTKSARESLRQKRQ